MAFSLLSPYWIQFTACSPAKLDCLLFYRPSLHFPALNAVHMLARLLKYRSLVSAQGNTFEVWLQGSWSESFLMMCPPKQKPALGSPAPPGVLAVVVFCFGCTWLISPILNLAKKSILISLPSPLRHCLMECLVWDWPFSRQLGDGKQQPHSGQMRFHIVWLIWSLSQLPNSFPSSSAIQKRCHLHVLTLLLNLGRRLETHTAVWFREGNAPGSLSAAAGNLNPTSACYRAVGVVRVLRRPWLSLNCERHLCGYPETSLVWNNLWGSDSPCMPFRG